MDTVTSAPMDIQLVNMDQMLKYITVMYTEQELKKHGLDKVVPTRQVTIDNRERGQPTIAYLDSDHYTKTVNGIKFKDTPKWVFKGRKLTKNQCKKVIALVLMSVIRTILENHICTFNGKYY